jgi:hypothetical protein
MRLGVQLLLACLAGCVQLPSVSLRVRARFERDAAQSARSLEARVDCGWSFERSAARAGMSASEHEYASERGAGASFEPSRCALPDACAWEEQSRAAALAAVVPQSPIATGDAR